MKKVNPSSEPTAPSEPYCRCEATIARVILEGYACGNPACWRTPLVQQSFDAFVAHLVKARGLPGSGDTKTANDP